MPNLTFASGHSSEAPPLLLEAARRLEPLDLGLARDTYLDALAAAQFAGRFGQETGIAYVARAAKAVPRLAEPRKRDVLHDAVTTLFADGVRAAVDPAREAMSAFSAENGTTDHEDLSWMWLSAVLAVNLWDEESWDQLTARHLRIARELGDLNQLPLVLHHRVMLALYSGELANASALLAESRTIHDATGAGLAAYGEICLAAWRGLPDAASLIATSLEDSSSRGEGGAVTFAHMANALLWNGLAQYPLALQAGLKATAYPSELGAANWALPELIEAAARAGSPDAADGAYDSLRKQAVASGSNWGLGILARATGLRATGGAAEAAYQEAIERLGRTRMRMDLARTQLVYGEWLRREGRRQDARGQLRTAYKLFSAAGAAAFAERAGRELAATGEVLDERSARTGSGRDSLTAQEAHIAGLAGAGLTNAEIGAQMFLSQHTVEWHLRKVFAKLGITSRKQLRREQLSHPAGPRCHICEKTTDGECSAQDLGGGRRVRRVLHGVEAGEEAAAR